MRVEQVVKALDFGAEVARGKGGGGKVGGWEGGRVDRGRFIFKQNQTKLD